MKLMLGAKEHCLLFVTPIFAGFAMTALPSKAATFASSRGFLETEFSQNSLVTETATNTNALTNAGSNSSVTAEALADATFVSDSSVPLSCVSGSLRTPAACNVSLSQAEGKGNTYFGLGQSDSKVIGNFSVKAGDVLSFDFLTGLSLEKATDNLDSEYASASGKVGFQLYDDKSNTLLNSFKISGNLNPAGSNFLLNYQGNKSLTFNQIATSINTTSGGNQEIQTLVRGSYSRNFNSQTEPILIGNQTNKVSVGEPQSSTVRVPEPSSTLAFLLFGLGCMGVKAKKKASQANSNL